ncbi:unnamed protein product, partial [Thlaspi arvense]
RLFDESRLAANPEISENNLVELREKEYSSWQQKYVEDTWKDNSYPKWLRTLVHGPMIQVTSLPIDDSIVQADSLNVETLTYLQGEVEDLDDPEVVAEIGSDVEDGNSDIELSSDESE